MNKKGFEFSFAWIFSIIVGAVIIILAVYATVKLVGTEKTVQDSETAKEIGILLNPIETGIETGKSAQISFSVETDIINDCFVNGDFGEQRITASGKSALDSERRGGEFSAFKNKYIFSEKKVSGEKVKVFSKPFEMPFKSADLIYIWSLDKRYCFVNPPREIESEIESLKLSEIFVGSDISECSALSEKVCFGSVNRDCDVEVSISSQSVKRGNDVVYYSGEDGALLLGAIFSSPEIYECQLKRLMGRVNLLSKIYIGKSDYFTSKGCSSNLEGSLQAFESVTAGFESSEDIRNVQITSDEIRRRNELLVCKLF